MGTADRAEVHTVNGHQVTLTHLDKVLWPEKNITKRQWISAMVDFSGYMLPFLKGRRLTVVRYPDGAAADSFFQKHWPDYTPDYVLEAAGAKAGDAMVCNDIETFLWLCNQGSFEWHVPFQRAGCSCPSEIVVDLDPPDASAFNLAVKAAQLLKKLFDRLALTSFVKTSGNKGLQLYIPLPEETFTYTETRMFLSFAAELLLEEAPDLFTVERLKKNRKGKLYIDYIQHDAGKTIIAPYSVRGNSAALVATPLEWHEVTDSLDPALFPLETVRKRLNAQGSPFSRFRDDDNRQAFLDIIQFLKQSDYKANGL